jgi:predicted nuclease of predicted toxin-antitoxin system
MSLQFLLDENMSQVVAAQVHRHRPAIVIESVHTWQDGVFEGRQDKALLLAARAEGLTLITYDQKTIPDLLIELYAEGGHHAGIIFVDDVTIPSADFGMLTRALISFWERYHSLDWQDRVHFLDRPPRA